MQAYSDPTRAKDSWSLPDVEVFWAETGELWSADDFDADGPNEAGFYWHSCFPGCMPDSDPFGPFDTEAEALKDAQRDD